MICCVTQPRRTVVVLTAPSAAMTAVTECLGGDHVEHHFPGAQALRQRRVKILQPGRHFFGFFAGSIPS